MGKKRILRTVLLLPLWAFCSYAVAGQGTPPPSIAESVSAYFISENAAPLIGEPVTLLLVANVPPNVVIAEWPQFPEQWGDLSVSQIDEIQIEVQADGTSLHQQTLTIRLWQTGTYETPETLIGYQVVGNPDVFRLSVRPFAFNVPSVLVEGDMALRPLKAQIGFFYIPLWAFIGGGLVVGALGIVCFRYWQLARLSRLDKQPVRPPSEIALAALDQLKTTQPEPTIICDHVSTILRTYITSRFDFAAMELTTIELLNAPHTQQRLGERTQFDLRRLLEQTDLVKFANLSIDEQTVGRVISGAQRWISAVEEETQAPELVAEALL
jgi:hypothetical protein